MSDGTVSQNATGQVVTPAMHTNNPTVHFNDAASHEHMDSNDAPGKIQLIVRDNE